MVQRRELIPTTFYPDNPRLLKEDLERLARAIQQRVDQEQDADPRPVSASEPIGAGGNYLIDPSSSPVSIDLPTLDPESAGASVTLIRTAQGTAPVRPVEGRELDYLPPDLGAYEVFWSGTRWHWRRGARRTSRHSWGAADLMGGFGEPSLGVSGSATLMTDPLRSGALVRAFGTTGHDAVKQSFYVPTGVAGDLTLRTYHRSGSGPTGYGVVQRQLRARSFFAGSGIPSGWTVYTLPAVTMPSGTFGWSYREDKVPLGPAGIQGGCRVELVLSRPSNASYTSPDLNTSWLVESLTVEFEE